MTLKGCFEILRAIIRTEIPSSDKSIDISPIDNQVISIFLSNSRAAAKVAKKLKNDDNTFKQAIAINALAVKLNENIINIALNKT